MLKIQHTETWNSLWIAKPFSSGSVWMLHGTRTPALLKKLQCRPTIFCLYFNYVWHIGTWQVPTYVFLKILQVNFDFQVQYSSLYM